MGALQRWSAPQWRYFKRQRLADVMDNSGGHTHAALRRAQRVSWAPLHVRTRRRTHRSPAAPLEHRDVHHHPDGNPPALPAPDHPQRYRAKNRPPSGCMGSGRRLRYWWRIRRALARSISPLLGVGHPGVPGEDLTHPGAPGGFPLSHAMDYIQVEGWVLPDGVHLHQDIQACLGIPPLKAPWRPPSDSEQGRPPHIQSALVC